MRVNISLSMFVRVTVIGGLHSEQGSPETVLVPPGSTRMPVVQVVYMGRIHDESTWYHVLMLFTTESITVTPTP